ncbi:50S ribosomal protein L11 methyltransferase [bacterium]|nr:50S ribosomal protein L11 methyltransferase [bacterium]
MEWAKIEVKLPGENKEPLIGFLLSKGIHQWEESDATAIIYLPNDVSLKNFLLALVEFLFENIMGRWELAVSQIEERDWAREWKESFLPRKVGEKLVIKPPWAEYEEKEGEIVLEIEPRSAFGTGEHPSTRLALILLERYIKKGDLVIDVGCGSGILSLASVLLGARKAIGVDIDERAIDESRENAERLSVSDRTEFIRGNLLKDIPVVEADIILCNIDLPSLRNLFSYLPYYLKRGGYLIASGFTEEGYKHLEVPEFLEEVEREREGDWLGIVWMMK